MGRGEWLMNIVIRNIELQPWEKLNSNRGTCVPTFQTLVLVIVVLKIKSGENRTLPEIMVDFNKLPASKRVILDLLRL